MEQVDGVEIINGQFQTWKEEAVTALKESKLIKKASKQAKKGVKAVKRENANRPLWRIVAGLFICCLISWKVNIYKYAIQLLLFGTVKMIWSVLLGLTVAPFIQGWNDNKKVK
tara:strand:- start:22 stop:360 length:339 start_codon:yes stop_codon:yes gene_type:complete